jgi:beta-galactosidase
MIFVPTPANMGVVKAEPSCDLRGGKPERKCFCMKRFLHGCFLFLALVLSAHGGQAGGASFVIGSEDFLLDGKPFVIRCGEMHFARIPREYWAHRLRMAHAMGLNTVCAYLFWNLHEPRPGEFNFRDGADVAAFCRAAQAEGLKVVLRPGPYACAEWDFGGMPAWLLKTPGIQLRSREPQYLAACRRYLRAVGRELAPLQVTRGGPILMVQVENEYGSFGKDKKYIRTLRDELKASGFEVPLFTCDGPSQLPNDTLSDLFCVVNFGGSPEEHFKALRDIRATGPLMCGEYYPGWFDSWLEPHHFGDTASILKEIGWMLDHRASFSIYMVHGGTSFGFSSGANSPPFSPQITSYDYDAPISEAGWATPKYEALRELLGRHLLPGEVLPAVPERQAVIAIPPIEFAESAPLLGHLPRGVKRDLPATMEMWDQAHGCVLYRAQLPAGTAGTLRIEKLRDFGLVCLDGRRLGTLDRRKGEETVSVPARPNPAQLDVLVDTFGHINYGSDILDPKGIAGHVSFGDASQTNELKSWEVFSLPLDARELRSLRFKSAGAQAPAFHRASFKLAAVGDTFLDMRSWGKGMVWVNGHNLGRFWNVGPQQTLYCPGCWLKRGRNDIVVLEMLGVTERQVPGLREPILNTLYGEQRRDWRTKQQPIVPRSYLCGRASQAPAMDGKLEEGAWAAAPWTENFVDIEGLAKPAPRFRTRAKLLWDEECLYVAAELEEPHVWATLTNHDSVIFRDPDFEVFLNPSGDTHHYYEFEINALNTSWDLRLDKPYLDEGKPDDGWSIPGLRSAVHVRGTLNNPTDLDQGWTVELAFPWKAFQSHGGHASPPAEGEQWRLGFSRVEWQILTNHGRYEKVPGRAEDNWIWSPQGVVDMHRPEMWGVVQFTGKPGAAGQPVAALPGKPARDAALDIYHAQRDFRDQQHRWATNVAELEEAPMRLSAGVEQPVIQPTPDGYICAVGYQDGTNHHIWRIRHDRLLKLDEPMPVETEVFVARAGEKYGDLGRRAAWFLVDNMPPHDRASLGLEFLMENLELALQARQRFPWAKAVPERLYFNDVLPYASLDEPRDPWRADFFRLAGELVKDCTNATQAIQALNRELFKRVNVHYNLGRKRNNQSPKESIEQGKATCTGLSIILVDACRAVGIPARVLGVPEWAHKQGNHTWVEAWDGDWFFAGADEYDPAGLNHSWFVGDAALTARSTNRLNQVYATSWRRTGDYFPLAWDSDSHEVAAVNVSARYAGFSPETNHAGKVMHLRLREHANGERLAAEVEMRSERGELLARGRTRAGTADLNDMPDFALPAGAERVVFRFTGKDEVRETAVTCAVCSRSETRDFVWDELSPVPSAVLEAETWFAKPLAERGAAPEGALSRAEAARLCRLAWEEVCRRRAADAAAEVAVSNIVLNGKKLKWMEKTFGAAPEGERSLWITLHGGGQGTEEDNDRNWWGYYGRYEFPPGSINIAPRAPANSWDMWHVKWTDDLLDRLIADMVLARGVNPNRVYLIGYSAGGDGVYQLAPRMSDRFAAAGMCAGHPNEVTPEGLRNLPFFLYMGGEDSAYKRNVVVRQFSAGLDALRKADPEGYRHRLTVYEGLSHNMQGREAEMIPRMTPLRRTAWPRRVVWKQDDDAVHTRFYWLERSAEEVKPNEIYAARAEGQTITLEAPEHGALTLRLSDKLLDLDRPVRVVHSGKTVFEGKVPRSLGAMVQSLKEREDPDTVAAALLRVVW